jgi:hypothetical protein
MSEYEAYVKGLRQLASLKPALDAKVAEADAVRRAAETRTAHRHADTVGRMERLTTSAQGQVDRANAILETAGLAKAPEGTDLNSAFATQRAAVDELEAAVRTYRAAPQSTGPTQSRRRSRRPAAAIAAALVLALAVLICVIIFVR